MTIFKIILLHFWKYKWVIIPFALVFFLIAAMFSLFSDQGEFESESLIITVVDQSESEASEALIDYLEEGNQVEVVADAERSALEEAVFLSQIHGAVIIDQDFDSLVSEGEAAVEVIRDERATASMQLETELSKFMMFMNAQYNDTGSLDAETLNSALSEGIDVSLNDDTLASSEENYNNAVGYSNFTAYWLMLFLMMTIGNLMSEYNKPELQKRIIAAPVSSTSSAIQILASQSLVGIFAVLIMFFGLVGLYYDRLEGIPLSKIFVALMLITLFTLAMQFAINALTTNRFMVNGLANLITLGLAFMSGIFVPIELFGDTAKSVAEFLPLYHYTQIYGASDISWAETIPSIAVLLLYTIAFLIIGIIFNNQRKSTQM